MMSLDFWLRAVTILMFAGMRIYWYVTKTKSVSKPLALEKIGIIVGAFIVGINLLGFTVFRFENSIIQLLGFILVVFGSLEAVLGRSALGNNWTESYAYHIKNHHQLITEGLYKYVRHPIYGGLLVAITGAFLVAKTFLFIPTFLFLLIVMVKFAKREEKLLRNYFGDEYGAYMQKTKMFIPFIY